MNGVESVLQENVERILRSECFRNAPSSRRLLRYLADHAATGDADRLKEYTIGVDAFGKPEDYDPRQDSTARIQIGRLRKKLFDYYQSEGREEAMVVSLPKGRLRLLCEPSGAVVVEPPVQEDELQELSSAPVPPPGLGRKPKMALIFLAAILCIAGGYVAGRLGAGSSTSGVAPSPWSSDLDQLWSPFVHSARPLVISVGNPLFLQFKNKTIYRDPSIEKWDDLLLSPSFAAVSKALGNPETKQVNYYAAVGEVNAAFLLGQRLGPRQPGISLFRSSQFSWQQMADSNVLFLGPPRFFNERLGSMPVVLEIGESPEGFRILHPQAGEPELYTYRDPPGFFGEDGEARVLVTHAAGPNGNTDVMTFASNSTFGRVGAVDAFTDPVFARMLTAKLQGTDSAIPRYFQVLLRVKYKGGVPTETTYLLHRKLVRR